MLLNPTAAWIWQHRHQPNLAADYAEHFGLTPAQAESDLRQTLAAWANSEPFRTLTLQLLETTFQLQLQTEAIAEELLPRLAHLEIPAVIPQHTIRVEQLAHATQVHLNGTLLASEQYATGARAVVLQELTRLALPKRRFAAILHAGACATSTAALILAGPSFSGKSTLCTHLMQAGLLCLSDDSACLTQDFQVVGMPFALAIREGAWPLFPHLTGQRFLASNLNGTTPEIPPRALIFINYRVDAPAALLEPIDPFEALIQIQKSGFWLEHTQTAIAAFLSWLAQIPRYTLTYGTLESAGAKLDALLRTCLPI